MLISSSILMNAARGGIIDEKALSEILHEGKIFIDLFLTLVVEQHSCYHTLSSQRQMIMHLEQI